MLTIYKASAGSGKTFTLAFEYIKTLLGIKEQGTQRYRLNSDRYSPAGHRMPYRHRGIMAITFTNAATEEMKSRIVKELGKLAKGSDPDSLYTRWLLEAYGCTAPELCETASKALSEILYDYGSFNVSTIDSFFQSVLRTFSREVDHQGDYELSLDTDNTVRQSISLMLDELNYSKPANADRLFAWIKRYTLTKMSEGSSYNFFQRDGHLLTQLSKVVSGALDEIFAQYSRELRQYLADPARIERFSRELKTKADAAIDPARDSAAAFFSAVKSRDLRPEVFNPTIVGRMRDLLQGKKNIDINKETIRKYADGADPKKIAVGTRLKELHLKAAEVEDICLIAAEFCRHITKGWPLGSFYRELNDSLGVLDFFGMAIGKLEEYLRDNNTVLISDTGDLLSRIISDAEMPFIYERLGMRLTNLLIDEFQDTSKLQWHNLKPLVANSLATDNDNLIIGDEKQSIYRFRNSDSSLLGHIVQNEDFPRQSVPRGFSPEDNTNHRSSHEVVRVNNTLYGRVAAAMRVDSYSNVVQTPSARITAPGYVRMEFIEPEVTDSDVLERLALYIKAQHSRGYAWADILILARWRREVEAVVDYLTKNHPDIKVLSSEALLLSSSSSVRTIMSMLKLIERSYSGKSSGSKDSPVYATTGDIAMMITRFNYFVADGYAPEDALRLALDGDGSATEGLDKEIKAIRAENPANLVALVEAVIKHKIAPARRKSEYAYIAALQDLVIKHCESPDPSLASFIRDYDANLDKWAIKASASLDAVEIMTIHKSKGLQRACVHIPFADWEMLHGNQSVWLPLGEIPGIDPDTVPPVLYVRAGENSALRNPAVSPYTQFFDDNETLERIDSLNLAYVAFTRAERELIVYSRGRELGKYLREAIESEPLPVEDDNPSCCDLGAFYDKEKGVLEAGVPTTRGKSRDTVPAVDAGSYEVLFRDDARELVSIDDAFATHLDIGGEEDKEICDEADNSDPALLEAANRGNRLHKILAGMRTVADLDKAVDNYAARASVPAAEADDYRSLLRECFARGGRTVAGWFDPACRVYAERSIFNADAAGEGYAGTDTFRPDRIVVTPAGETVVVDYKFTSTERPSHFRQVENYISLLKRLGKQNVSGYLWYPLRHKIIEVR